jgi:hypothetical protein
LASINESLPDNRHTYDPFRLAVLNGPVPLDDPLLEPHPRANPSTPSRAPSNIFVVNLEGKISQEDSDAPLTMDTTPPPLLDIKGYSI